MLIKLYQVIETDIMKSQFLVIQRRGAAANVTSKRGTKNMYVWKG